MHDMWASDLAPMIFVAFFGAVAVLAYPIAQGLRRRLEGKAPADLRREVEGLRDEVARLQAGGDAEVHSRLLELEERLDFAERLLASGGGTGTGKGA